jgi:hypothetical protein
MGYGPGVSYKGKTGSEAKAAYEADVRKEKKKKQRKKGKG